MRNCIRSVDILQTPPRFGRPLFPIGYDHVLFSTIILRSIALRSLPTLHRSRGGFRIALTTDFGNPLFHYRYRVLKLGDSVIVPFVAIETMFYCLHLSALKLSAVKEVMLAIAFGFAVNSLEILLEVVHVTAVKTLNCLFVNRRQTRKISLTFGANRAIVRS
ncbi:hypothetical protein BKA64DRAFT_665198 [Cadophora sp. MPI-SDFR-AT-0126]|nr:hypothetical protein BKA64DRAFT_665198 [Leotiomycetes sp. MPI-SDFR-AT-0126]